MNVEVVLERFHIRRPTPKESVSVSGEILKKDCPERAPGVGVYSDDRGDLIVITPSDKSNGHDRKEVMRSVLNTPFSRRAYVSLNGGENRVTYLVTAEHFGTTPALLANKGVTLRSVLNKAREEAHYDGRRLTSKILTEGEVIIYNEHSGHPPVCLTDVLDKFNISVT